MALEDYNSVLIEHLEELEAAAELADGDEAAIWLAKLREHQFDADALVAAQVLFEVRAFDALLQWAGEQLAELRSEEDPFAGGFDFDVDDAFMEVGGSSFREPVTDEPSAEHDDQDASVGAATENDAAPNSDAAAGPHVSPGGRPHVLSGRFNLVRPAQVAADLEQRSLSQSLDEAAKGVPTEPSDPNRETRPNLTPNVPGRSAAAEATANETPFDSGTSQVRHAPEEPAPSLERLPPADTSGEIASVGPELSDAEEPKGGTFRADTTPPPAVGFDFGFEDDFASSEEPAVDPAQQPTLDASVRRGDKVTAERNRELTPLRALPAQDPEDMFFEMAEALAAEASNGEQYRGEPIRGSVHAAQTNPFGNDAPTGTAHLPVAAARISDAASSHIHTNLNAIVLEARRLRTAGELDAALDITKKVLSRGANPEAEELRDQLESQLELARLERLGDLTRTPVLAVELSAMSDLDLDHRAGYVMSQIDGMMTYEDLLELSGMSRLETLAVFCVLLERGVIEATR